MLDFAVTKILIFFRIAYSSGYKKCPQLAGLINYFLPDAFISAVNNGCGVATVLLYSG